MNSVLIFTFIRKETAIPQRLYMRFIIVSRNTDRLCNGHRWFLTIFFWCFQRKSPSMQTVICKPRTRLPTKYVTPTVIIIRYSCVRIHTTIGDRFRCYVKSSSNTVVILHILNNISIRPFSNVFPICITSSSCEVPLRRINIYLCTYIRNMVAV